MHSLKAVILAWDVLFHYLTTKHGSSTRRLLVLYMDTHGCLTSGRRNVTTDTAGLMSTEKAT